MIVYRESTSGVSQLNKIPRLFRIVKLLRIFRLAKLLPRLEEALLLSPIVLRLLKILLLLFCAWHWIGCIYFFISDLEDFGYEKASYVRENGNSWTPPATIWCGKIEAELCNETFWNMRREITGYNPFIGLDECFESNRCPASFRLQYLHALYWVSSLHI